MFGWIRRGARLVTPTGRSFMVVALVCLVIGAWSGLTELSIIGWMCLVLLLLAVPWLLLPVKVHGTVGARPPSAVAGESIEVRLTATHVGGLPVWQPLVRVVSGDETIWTRLATLRPGRNVYRVLELATPRRGVLAVGPVEHLVTDPLGLLRVARRWAPAIEVYVRPRMIGLRSLGFGQLRDLEGAVTDTLSMSDLAFHALREYHPGDDMRHVHWRSSARAGEVLVRQYQESRRNRTTVIVDCAESSYGESAPGQAERNAFEVAVSVAASIVALSGQKGEAVTLVAGAERLVDRSAQETLDGLCRIDLGPADKDGGLTQDIARALSLSPETGTLVIVSGRAIPPEDLAARLWVAPQEVRTVTLRVDPGADVAVTAAHGREVHTLGSLADLPGLFGTPR